MKKIFILVFIFIVLALPAKAEDSSQCDSSPDIPVNITPRFDDPKYDFSVDIPTLQSLSNDTRHTIHEHHQGLTLGLTYYEPMIEFRAPVRGVKFPNGLACAHVDHVDHVDVTIGYKDVTVYIPREIPRSSCSFGEVMAHEQKHIAVNQQILEEYAPMIAERLRDYLKLNGVFREESPDHTLSLLQKKLQAILNEMAEEMIAENRRRQKLVDSPEEYQRLSLVCHGQLQTITRQFLTGEK